MIKLRFPGDFIYVSSPFGKRVINGKTKMHNGVDLGWSSKYGGQNTPIFAAADGTIITSIDGKNNDTSTNTFGNYIIIDHGDGVQTLYGHLLKNSLLKKGTKVKQGQVIAKKNNSGYSYGSHCHFEVRINGAKVDPLKYTYADIKMVISSDTVKNYKILKYDFSKPEPKPEPKPVPKPTPKPVEQFPVGTRVKIIAKGNGSSYGKAKASGGVGWIRYVTKIWSGRPYPYQVGNRGKTDSANTTGFFKAKALKKI